MVSEWSGSRCALYNDFPTEEEIVKGCQYWEQPQPWKRPSKWSDK